jgi:hypothetical protein
MKLRLENSYVGMSEKVKEFLELIGQDFFFITLKFPVEQMTLYLESFRSSSFVVGG